MTRFSFCPSTSTFLRAAIFCLGLVWTLSASAADSLLTLHGRSQYKGEQAGHVVKQQELKWKATETAIVVCDMWDQHWCKGATRRVGRMAPRMNEVIAAARKKGVQIIHCPSSCLNHYKDTPQRNLARLALKIDTEIPLQGWCHLDKTREGRLPIDDSDGGCDCQPQCKQGSPWRRQIDTIKIEPGDAITDSGEAYYLMRQKGIKNVIVMGVHTNMCVLGRPFSVRQMFYQGQNVVLMRDMTDTMYNPRMRPFVSHFHGTELVTDHIEKHWCPTITSTDFTGRAPFRFANDPRKHVVFLVGEQEYQTAETLPAFAKTELESRGIRCTFVHARSHDLNNFPGIEAIKTADLLVVSVRRRTLPQSQLKVVRDYVEAGGPLVGIRTASHAFSLRGGKQPPEGHASWESFDAEVLGGNYRGHHGNNSPPTLLKPAAGAEDHPILDQVDLRGFKRTGSLYKVSPLTRTTQPLLVGSILNEPAEPVAWTNRYQDARIFYTSLGHIEEFKIPAFRRLLVNAIHWAMDQPVAEAKIAAGTSIE